MNFHYQHRGQAGRFLAEKLARFANRPDVLVLALVRGGVPVGFEIALALNVPMDVFIVRKLGVPGQSELAFGAIASGGVRVLNEDVIQQLSISDETIDAVAQKEERELRRRELEYRHGREQTSAAGRMVILVDDGLATGASMRAAISAVRHQHPARLIVAVPVGAATTCIQIEREADELICLHRPHDLGSVGAWYRDFGQTSDQEVCELLNAGHQRAHPESKVSAMS